jgi:ribonucleoside-triphosphate reductase
MIQLTNDQVRSKCNWIRNYITAPTAADGSTMDANANVSSKNIATMQSEINKDINIQVNRSLIQERIKRLFGTRLSKEYVRELEDHVIYTHDETSLMPYCVSITMYPFLLNGLSGLGGESEAPNHINSFCGGFINLVFAVASQFAGAVATPEFLMYFDYFARKDLGENYLETHRSQVENLLQSVVYSLNQPAAARGYQSVFWNISLFDSEYFDGIFGEFMFPDGDKPVWKSVDALQNFFLEWFNNERTKAILTFPVVTVAMLGDTEKGEPVDTKFARNIATEMSKGNSFFIYTSNSADSLASCCRLRNEMSENQFSYSLGAGGVATGSINVITLNINRLIQEGKSLRAAIDRIHKYQIAFRKLMEEYQKNGLLPVYDAGFIDLDKQFLTIGINGMVEAAEYMGIEPGNNDEYKQFVSSNLKIIYDANKEAKAKYGYMFNTEFVPAENLGVKNANWDKSDGLFSPRDCYNSYFYPVENKDINIIDKFILHGEEIVKYLDGGSALHLNLEQLLDSEGVYELIKLAIKTGTNYFTFNVKSTICNTCGYIDKNTLLSCSKCGSTNIDYATRIIGYLKRVSAFSQPRSFEESLRVYS